MNCMTDSAGVPFFSENEPTHAECFDRILFLETLFDHLPRNMLKYVQFILETVF